MSIERGLFVTQLANGRGTTALNARRALAAMFEENSPNVPRSGVLDNGTSLAVTGASNMSYNLQPEKFVISRAAAEGVYAFTSLGVSNVVTSPAPGADSRWDLIYVKQNDPDKGDRDANGDPSNDAVIGVIVGVAAASPSVPSAALPAGAYEVARARVYAGATATNQGAGRVEITQSFRYTALRGAAIPVRNAAERDEIRPARRFQSVQRIDTGTIEEWTGTSWEARNRRQHSEWLLTNWNAAAAQPLDIPFRTRDPQRSVNDQFVQLVPNSDGRFEVFEEGVYSISMHLELGGASTGETYMAIIGGQNVNETLQTVNVPEGAGGYSLAFPNMYLKPGVTSGPGGIFLVRFRHPTRRTLPSARLRVTRVN